MHVANVSIADWISLTRRSRSTCILDETVLTRNSTFPETEDGYVTYIALLGSGTMRGEWASSAPPRSKTLGYRSLEQSSITIQTPRMATDALHRFYFLKYRPCLAWPVHAPAWGSFESCKRVAARRVSGPVEGRNFIQITIYLSVQFIYFASDFAIHSAARHTRNESRNCCT